MIALSHYRSLPATRSTREAQASSTLKLLAMLEAWADRRRQRHALLELSDHALKDIGLTRADAFEEGIKPFWRA